MLRRETSLCIIFLFTYIGVHSQDVGEVEWKKIIVKEWNIHLFLNTHGGGLGFQYGRTPTYNDKHFWEIDFLYNTHYKAVLGKNTLFSEATVFSYGKLCDLFFLRGGYGYQRTLHQKPYWGGVRVRYTLSGGVSVGMALPVYLRIADFAVDGSVSGSHSARYNPDQHTLGNIIGRSSFFDGIGKTTLHPGFYVKSGVSFDFSKDESVMHAIEVGLTYDMIFPFVQQIAFNKALPFHLCAYLAYNFGKRKSPHE